MVAKIKSPEFFHADARKIEPFAMDSASIETVTAQDLRDLGIDIQTDVLRSGANAFGMDAQALVTQPSLAVPVQFLQTFLPGLVRTLTAARKADDLMGVTVAGRWEDEEVVQQLVEPTGQVMPYGDSTNIPLGSWNVNYERRSVVRFERGFNVGTLEEARASAARLNTAAEKRNGAALALEIQRNLVGFYGYNAGSNRTYGFLNDPALPAYVTVANGASSSPLWASKTFIEITADIRAAFAALQSQSQDNIGMDAPLTLAIATASAAYMSVTAVYGNMTVRQWFEQTFPNGRIVSAPQLTAANGGANVFYLYADTVDDGSTDNNRTWEQITPAKMRQLGVERRAKEYVEDFSAAYAGVMLKRPYAVVRYSGV